METKELGMFIAKRRTELGMTQAQLAERLHVTNKAISKWENGRGLPDIANVEGLADALDLSLQELMECRICRTEDEAGDVEQALRETLEFAQVKIKKAIYKCIPVIMIAWGLMFTFIYVMCMYMDLGQHLELRAILIGFLVLEAGLTGNILNTLVRRE
ncbi:MAG: helix-turn-helix domain-containing protein [Lachnospiraceae bacterium]|nr:helix-turn-helix domain-containing protein [Lachnospiraceae bacterium]